MENAAPQPQEPTPAAKWLKMGRKILIGALIMYAVNFFLKQTGWDTWEKFSAQADSFAENIMTGAARLSPMALWNSITTNEYTYDTERGNYFSTRRQTGKLTIKDKIANWFGYYWYTASGRAFWAGRILLILAIVAGILLAKEDYDKARDKTTALFVFPFNMLLKFFIFLLSVSIICLLLYLVIKLFLAIGAGIVFIVSGIHATGGFTKLLYEEAKGEAAGSAKKTVAGYLLPFLFRKKK
ncbi:MAG: hypothetical protein JNN00_15660 [Chitinophagaceae bacterium]|nr:hypothetical protein [Chitinophagaceae bacterium]